MNIISFIIDEVLPIVLQVLAHGPKFRGESTSLSPVQVLFSTPQITEEKVYFPLGGLNRDC